MYCVNCETFVYDHGAGCGITIQNPSCNDASEKKMPRSFSPIEGRTRPGQVYLNLFYCGVKLWW